MNPNPNKETPEQELDTRDLETKLRQDLGMLEWQIRDLVPLIDTHYKAREAEQKPIGDAIEVKVAAPTMRFVLNTCRQSDRTIAKRILDQEQNVAEWRDVSSDEPIELKIWQLKIIASLNGKYNWAVFLLEPDNLPVSKESKS